MKTRKISIPIALVTVFSLSILSCGKTDHQEGVSDSESAEQLVEESLNALNDSSREAVELTIPNDKIPEIVAAYLVIKDALVATDGEKTSEAAKALMQQLEEYDEEMIQWLRKDVLTIVESSDPEDQRKNFELLSENIYLLVKSDDKFEGTLYRQYCPMAFSNKGAYWLSSEEQIANPYFGDRMLRCGSVKEKIN